LLPYTITDPKNHGKKNVIVKFYNLPQVAKRSQTKGLFVWVVAGWLCRESCCVEKAAVQKKLLY
jgi:hypothetical protein